MGKLVPCKTCKKQIDLTAKSCPHCGVRSPGTTSSGCLPIILVAFMGIVFVIFLGGQPAAPRTPEEQREQQIRKGFSAFDGSHRKLESLVKETLKDPSSYDHVKTTFVDQGTKLTVYMTYRAKNSFGAIVPGVIVAETSLEGDVIRVIGQP